MLYGYESTVIAVGESTDEINIGNTDVRAQPVPFSRYTSISYSVPKQAKCCIKIYDDAGRLVRTIVDENMMPGNYTARWDGTDSQGRKVAASSYFCVVKTNGESTTKVVRVK